MPRILSQLYQHHDVIPVTWLNMPLWALRTYRDHRSQAARRGQASVRAPLADHLLPNLDSPVFALGAPRSGTTFLGDGLATLPEISYYFEPVLTKAAVRHVFNGDWKFGKARWAYRQTYAWLMRVQGEPQRRFCEKTPGNCFIIPFLDKTFSNARFIHIVRDGRDSALSLVDKQWYSASMAESGQRDPDGYPYGPSKRFFIEPERVQEYESTDDLHRCIWLWRRYVEEALAGCAQLPAERVLQIRYEDLIMQPESSATQILDFIGIDAPESRDHYVQSVVNTARPDSLARWRTAPQVQENPKIWEEAGKLLSSLGYSRD